MSCSRQEAEKWVKLGEANGLLRAADIVCGWDISKGGYTELAHVIREEVQKLAPDIFIRECRIEDVLREEFGGPTNDHNRP